MMPAPYCPPLLRYTLEDKAAKGLRRAPAGPVEAEYVPALEMVAETPRLLLLAPRGGGKTRFARHLLAHLPEDPAGLRRPVPRNERGTVAEEAWSGPVPRAVLRDIAADLTADPLAGLPAGDVLLILDGIEAWGEDGPARLAALATALPPGCRLLLLGEESLCAGWPLPPGLRRFAFLPLLRAQRAGGGAALAEDPLLGHPGLFALAREMGESAPSATALVENWLARRAPAKAIEAAAEAATALLQGQATPPAAMPSALATALAEGFLREHLAARAVHRWPPAKLAALYRAEPARWEGVLRLLAQRLREAGQAVEPLAQALLEGAGPQGAVLAAELLPGTPLPGLVAALCAAVAGNRLPLPARVAAGRHLARLGDPRDLADLVLVPAGECCIGSVTHANSVPPHRVLVGGFRMGRYPVTNALYARFIAATGRPWLSPTGHAPERANAPATDLSWHDARAFCAWITPVWRMEGRIGPTERVRLPTEAEWEYAARGTRAEAPVVVYPWGLGWRDDAANAEEAGLNETCAVGLFPAGRSPFGCEDMAGHVWEWCSTLWGSDMARPSFPYPYTPADGREAPEAAPDQRRVLRGGCFSSGQEKACCHYRGSLEPAGSWRGNGFRVAVD
ncbi:formylglycine-generating enzyme family protein [Roseomonas sp. GC11]|uniref:formylglycine-generating enzyme family protein n=1 Tax=Roseomonas sp. GC11 TaxID=2950546 RepID=UPI00210EFCDF|nr:formylglycine-generating enzyme family protein [Roseomonas sp. GC11]MCQ4162360.1 formylglycine-generating enzyme family protein [Roseomonas sp. GC11]